jgi:DNA gyrase subunit A
LLKALKKDLRSLKRKYADSRRTKITVAGVKGEEESGVRSHESGVRSHESGVRSQEGGNHRSKKKSNQPAHPIADSKPNEEETVLEFTQQGYVQRLRPPTEQKSTRSKKGDEFVVQTQLTVTQAELVVITSGGKAYPVKVRDIPPVAGRKQGTPLVSLLPEAARSETVVAHFMLPEASETVSLILLTQQGRIKRLPVSELTNLTARGMTLIKFKEDDHLEYVRFAQTGEQLVLATSNGRILRFEINDQQLPMMGRSAQGTQALRVSRREKLIGCAVLSDQDNLFLISEHGYGKRLPVNALRRGNRGDLGTQALQFKTSTDVLVGIVSASQASEVVLLTDADRMLRLKLDAVKLWGKDGTGDHIAQLKPEEKVTAVLMVNCS